MAFGISKDPSRLISAAVLILCGLGQIGQIRFDLMATLIVAGIIFIMEALNW